MLGSGRYAWQRVQPPLVLSVDAGWTVDYESASGFDLVRDDTPHSTLTVALLQQVFATPCAGKPIVLGARTLDVAAWLRSNTGLVIASERPSTIGGRPAIVFDVTAGSPCIGGATDLPLFELNGELFALDPGDVAEITVLELNGRPITTVAAGPTSSFTAFVSRTRSVVESLTDR